MTIHLANPISIAVISDLHIGRARALDLYPPGSAPEDSIIDQNYVADFVDFVQERDITADYLVVPGDISNTGQSAQIALGSTVIRKCAAALKVTEDRIIFVPGNHDVDWNVLKLEDATGHYRGLRFSAFRNTDTVFRRTPNPEHNLYEAPYYAVWPYPDLLVVGYNTAWEEDPAFSVKHGSVEQRHLEQLAAELTGIPYDPTQVRLFVIHHHPIQYPDPTHWKDFSELQNASGLFSLLWDHHFDIVIHGHRHQPFLTRQSHGFGRHIPILCAGSFSAVLYPGWSNQIGNQFHMVEIEGRTSVRGSIQGQVRSWTYLTGRRWCESRGEYTGIAHFEGFGAYYDIDHLHEVLHPRLSEVFQHQDYIRWSTIADSDHALARLPGRQIKQALDDLGRELDFDVIRTETEDYLLLRKK